ncbi:MAG: FAD-dependent monooxygenase, partial [Pirellulales bacterium]
RRSLEVLHASVPVDNFIRHGRPVKGIQFEDDGSVIEAIRFGENAGLFPHGILLPQNRTEFILNHALEKLGARVERKKEVQSFSVCEERVDVEFRDGELARCDWLIGADGAHSTVRKGLGLTFPGVSIDRRWLLADLELLESGPEDHIRLFLSSAGLLGLFPYGKSIWRIIADAGPTNPDVPSHDPTYEDILQILEDRSCRQWNVGKALWLSEFRVNERQVDQYCHGRVMLAGDAAHIHSPAGGQGMNTSIQDAVNLSWKLAMVIKQQATCELLATYQHERHPVGAAVIQGSGRMLRVMMNQNPCVKFFRRRLLPYIVGIPPIRDMAVQRLSEVDITYRGGPLAQTHGDRWIGRRCPEVPWGDNGLTIYDLLRGTSFTVFKLGRGSVTEEMWDRVLRAAGTGVLAVDAVTADGSMTDDARAFAQTLAVKSGTIVVVRPDCYFGPVSQDSSSIISWFKQLKQL